MTRSEIIDKYFADHCARIEIVCSPQDQEEFATLGEDPNNLYRPYGWLPPVFVWYTAEDGLDHRIITFIYCNEIMTHQMEKLSDDHFKQYLDVIHYYLNLHIVYCETPVAQRDKMIEAELWNVGPGSLVFLNHFQMAVLDSVN